MVEGAARRRPPGTSGRRFAAALVAAIVAHVSAGWVSDRISAWRHRDSTNDRDAALDPDPATFEIEPLVQDDREIPRDSPPVIEPDPSSIRARTAESEHPSMKSPSPALRVAPEPSEVARRDVSSGAANEATPETQGPAVAPPQDNAARPRIDLGIGPDNAKRWMDLAASSDGPAGIEAPRSGGIDVYRPGKKSTTGGVQELLEAHDREVGLGSSGPVVTALEQAAHSEIAPALGTAKFVVTVLKSGAVEVALAAASDQVEAWREVGSRAADAIRRKRPRIPSTRDGVRLTIQIEAVEQLVNGGDPRGKAPTVVVAPPKIRSQSESEQDANRRNPVASTANADNAAAPAPRLNIDLPGVFVEGRGKVCSYRVGITPLGPMLSGGCDPSAIGTKPVRVVSAKVLDETVL